MRTLSADWMASTSKADPEQHSLHQETEEMRQNTFYPRPVAPTAAQVSFMFLNFEYAMIYQFKFLAPALPDKVCVRTFPSGAHTIIFKNVEG